MNNIRVTTVQAFFDTIALSYKNTFNQEIITSLLQDCDIKQNSAILEAGSGTSDFTLLLLDKIGRKGKIICNDLSEQMLSVAKNKINDPRVTCIQGDIATLSFATYHVDKVICFNMFPHIVDKSRCIKNIYDNITAGGELIICHDTNRKSIMSIHKNQHVPAGISHFPKTKEIIAEMQLAGFLINKHKDTKYFFIQGSKP